MAKKSDSNNKIIIDNDIVISSVMFDTCGAENSGFFDKLKKSYNVAIIPAGHRIYCGELKAVGYKWLDDKKGILSLILPFSGTGITLCTKEFNCMGEKLGVKDVFDLDFIKKFGIKLSDSGFDDMAYEFAYPRILSKYNELYVFKVGEKTAKKKLNDFFDYLYNFGNIVFLSDLHSNLPFDECTKLDEKTVNGEKDIFAFDWFFSLAEKFSKKTKFIGYINSADINGNTEKTTGYCSMVF